MARKNGTLETKANKYNDDNAMTLAEMQQAAHAEVKRKAASRRESKKAHRRYQEDDFGRWN